MTVERALELYPAVLELRKRDEFSIAGLRAPIPVDLVDELASRLRSGDRGSSADTVYAVAKVVERVLAHAYYDLHKAGKC